MNKLNLTPAATVLVLKDSSHGMEVLMVKRSSRPPFGDLFVFPGGKIDHSDFNNKIEDLCEDITDKEASIKLGLDSGTSKPISTENPYEKLAFNFSQETTNLHQSKH